MPSFISAATVLATFAFSAVSVSAFDAAASDNLAVYWVKVPPSIDIQVSLLTYDIRDKAPLKNPWAPFATTTRSTSSQLDSSMSSQMRLEAMGIPEPILEMLAAECILLLVVKRHSY
jgi:hypothetical protein